MREKKWYIREVVRIMRQIDNTVILMKIYTLAKTHLELLREKEGAV